jgi:hypothetical protein
MMVQRDIVKLNELRSGVPGYRADRFSVQPAQPQLQYPATGQKKSNSTDEDVSAASSLQKWSEAKKNEGLTRNRTGVAGMLLR